MAEGVSFRVNHLAELLAVTDELTSEIKRGVRDELRDVAKPVRDDAANLFRLRVSADPRKSNFGISVRKVGTITVEQRVKSARLSRRDKRPKFTDLVISRSLSPALERNEPKVLRAFDNVLARLERKWARG